MGRASVRAAVLAYLKPSAVTGLNALHRAMPKLTTPQEVDLATGGGSGALGIVHIRREIEQPDSMPLGRGSPAGFKQIDYRVGIVLRFWSVKVDAEEAMDDYDSMVDNLKARVRVDPQFGTGGSPIWQAGMDMQIDSQLPRQQDGSTFIWSVCEFGVVEWVQA